MPARKKAPKQLTEEAKIAKYLDNTANVKRLNKNSTAVIENTNNEEEGKSNNNDS